MKNKDKFRFIPHTGDIEFSAEGKDIGELFANCALALVKTITEDIISESKKKKIKVSGKDKEALLYNFLEEIVFLFDSENFVSSRAIVNTIKETSSGFVLEGDLIGDNSSDYEFKTAIKSVTYNNMFVAHDKKNKKWTARVVLDV